MAGLLDRARRESAGPPGADRQPVPVLAPEEAPQSREADISPAERREMLAQIEQHVARSRTPLTPERLAYQALRGGAWLPLVVNLVAVLLILAGVLLIPTFFPSREQQIAARERFLSAGGEASLVGAVKQESEQQLTDKEQQITGIQTRLSRTGQELEALRASRDAEIAKHEAELRAALAADLEAQRVKLEKSGATVTAMEQKLAALEEQGNAELARELERFRAQKDAELAAQQLAQEQEQARMAADLAALREQSQREQLALDQLTASYGQIADSLAADRWTEAITKVDSTRALLRQPAVAALPAIQRRASVDAFLLDSLRQLVDYESRAAAEQDTATARQALADSLAKADVQYAAGNWRAAIDGYAQALELLESEAGSLPGVPDRIADAGYRLGMADLASRQDRAAGTLVQKADAFLRQGDLDKAVASYASVIESYPASSFVTRALRGLEQALDAKVQRKQDEVAGRDRTMAALQAAEKARLEAERKAAETTQGRVKVATDGLGAAARRSAGSAEAARQELIALLQAKVLVKEVLATESVKAAHPGLSDSLERYVELSGEQKRGEGRAAALTDVSVVVDYLLGKRGAEDLAQVWARTADDAQRAAFQQVIDRLKLLAQ